MDKDMWELSNQKINLNKYILNRYYPKLLEVPFTNEYKGATIQAKKIINPNEMDFKDISLFFNENWINTQIKIFKDIYDEK